MAIHAQNLSKVYRLYHRPGDRLREALHPFRKKYHQDFYALREASLTLRQGETLGVIGRNGSGKSTLLKILCGILTPTSGQVAVEGRVAALLELGAGFNPELTGIENIYFSGTIMGYSRREMDARLAAITDFAGIGDYLDQPVKTYSSGMFVRLAFATAINVDPDILVVDEALAVGDISFQAKCFRKLNDFRQRGKTVLFVTHALDTVLRSCDRALVLDQGRVLADTAPKEAVDIYKRLLVDCYEPNAAPAASAADPALSYGNGKAEIIEAELLDARQRVVRTLEHGHPFSVRMRVRFREAVADPIFAFTIKDLKGLEITGTNTAFKRTATGSFAAGAEAVVIFSQTLNAQSGRYALSLGCSGYEADEFVVYHRIYDAVLFEVASSEPMVGLYDLGSTVTVSTGGAAPRE